MAVTYAVLLSEAALRDADTVANCENIVGGDLDGDGLDEVIADFGAAGVWSYQEGRGWAFVHSFNPKSIVTGRLR